MPKSLEEIAAEPEEEKEPLTWAQAIWARCSFGGFWFFLDWVVKPFWNWIVCPWYYWTVEPIFGGIFSFFSYFTSAVDVAVPNEAPQMEVFEGM